MTISALLGVFFGAVCGGAGRYFLSVKPGGAAGTLMANTAGCLILGFVSASVLPAWLGAALGAGAAGALSTWSTLAAELGNRIRGRRKAQASALLTVTILLGVATFYLGRCLGTTL